MQNRIWKHLYCPIKPMQRFNVLSLSFSCAAPDNIGLKEWLKVKGALILCRAFFQSVIADQRRNKGYAGF